MPGKPSVKGRWWSQSSQSFRAHIWSERGQRGQSSPLPTFVGVIQLEDIRVLWVIRQLHHPAYDGDLLARCRFILEKNNKRLGGLGPCPALPRETNTGRQGSCPP